ncbi:MAG: hypothetical protein JW991_05585 [Candidatus Pacebacteria bacterium]|nr:hypothetical protein [Candidatus Paceibacterota bacterium]
MNYFFNFFAHLKKALKITAGMLEAVVRVALFLLGMGLIFGTAYFLGFSYLERIKGNDSYNALNTIYWLARWWPKIPYWYPGQGAGVSFVWGYPMLASLLVVFVSFWQKINLTAAFRVLGFLSLPLTAVGMYIFVWRRLKNQAVSLVGAVFFLLMPLSWVWLFDWGFYAEMAACIFIFPTLLFYDRFLEGVIQVKIDLITRLNLLLAVFFSGITFATHPTVFFVIIRIAAIYSPIYLFLKRKKLRSFLVGLLPVFLLFLLSVLGVAFLVGNFQYYAGVASASAGSTLLGKEDFVAVTSIPLDMLFGFKRPEVTDFKYAVRNAVIPILVWGPAILGSILALFFSAKIFSLAVAAGISFLFLAKMEMVYFFMTKIPLASYFVGMRTEVLILRMIWPILAGFGIWAVPGLVLKLMTFWLRIKNKFLDWTLKTFKGLAAGTVTLGVAGYLIFSLADYPSTLWQRDMVRYGPGGFNIRDPFFREIDSLDADDSLPALGSETKLSLWRATGRMLLNKDYWPMADLTTDFFELGYERSGMFPYPSLREFNEQEGKNQFLRLDVSPMSGGITQTLNVYNQASMINLYTLNLNLLGTYWGYQQQVAFQENDGRLETAEEVAKWFGTKYLIYNRSGDEMTKYGQNDNWRDWDGEEADLDVLEYKESPKLWTLSQAKPAVLVIGSQEKRAYEPVFRSANKGGLPYDNFWLVQGEENLDSYSLAELKKFDVLMLFGYQTKNQVSSFRLLEDYLKSGGSVFISSGWQYVDQVWQGNSLPEFFPVESLVWTDDFNPSDQYRLDQRLIGPVEMETFGPLVWGEGGWGISAGSVLKPWAKPILKVGDRILVAGGEYKGGKIVWSGLNLVGHLHSFDYNQSEKDFLKAVFTWLSPSAGKDLSSIVSATRDFPDRIQFEFDQATDRETVFYFRESFFPSWTATIQASAGKRGNKLKIYRAGPGFKLMFLPKLEAGDSLVLEFKPGIRNLFLKFVSGATFFGLCVWVVFGKKLYLPTLIRLGERFKKTKAKAKKSWDKREEEEY